MGILKFIEIENFKSFAGKQVIGPLQPFTAIIGLNGSGKSNFMDAIGFVFEEKKNNLRVKKLSELIHGASVGAPVANQASVTVVYEKSDGLVIRFSRRIVGSSSYYSIDDEDVSHLEYTSQLKEINSGVKDFMVFQGAVESLAMKNPKERTLFFEQISGSFELKSDYDRLKKEVAKAEDDIKFAFQKKKGILSERKESKIVLREAEKYRELTETLASKQIICNMFKLYYNERECENLMMQRSNFIIDQKKATKMKQENIIKLEAKKVLLENERTNLAKIEKDIREAEINLSEKHLNLIKVKECSFYALPKLQSAKKSLNEADKVNSNHLKLIHDLEESLSKANQDLEDFNRELSSQGHDIDLTNSQIMEYETLKKRAKDLSTDHCLDLRNVDIEQDTDQHKLSAMLCKKIELTEKISLERNKIEEFRKRLTRLNEQNNDTNMKLNKLTKDETDIEFEVAEARERESGIQKELEDVLEKLKHKDFETYTFTRRREKEENLKRLKKLFPGIHGRIVNLCHLSNERYAVALTKVLGKNMSAIVVDTVKTARSCIQHLKDHRCSLETFLPLDFIKVESVKMRLRDIKEPRNVKLIYDILQFDPIIEKAVRYVTNNTLVCDTMEDACKLAYENSAGERYSVVSVDGTYYQKNGFLSGGQRDLALRARQWDNAYIENLEHERNLLKDELQKVKKQIQKEGDVPVIQSLIKGLNSRLEFSDSEGIKTEKKISDILPGITEMETELEQLKLEIGETEACILSRNTKLEEIKSILNSIEDDVFADFCKNINVQNIRYYEKHQLKAIQRREEKRIELDNSCLKIKNMLDYEREHNTLENVEHWQNTVSKHQAELNKLKTEETTLIAVIKEKEENINQLKNSKSAKELALNEIDLRITELHKKLSSVQKELLLLKSNINQLDLKLEAKKNEKHALLVDCNLNCISIPLHNGSMNDVGSERQELEIEVNYSILSEDLKNLNAAEEAEKRNFLDEEILKIQTELSNSAPNNKARQKLNSVTERMREIEAEYENVRQRVRGKHKDFEKVKAERYNKFMDCYNLACDKIDVIFKALTCNSSGEAVLSLENPEEPYLGGIDYSCVAPGKRFQPMCNLSGGEKTVAALALLFATHSGELGGQQTIPFFCLDEIDAALDNTNIGKVARFIQQKKSSVQFIVISLKRELFSHADVLVGIIPDQSDGKTSSRVITMNLEKYGQ